MHNSSQFLRGWVFLVLAGLLCFAGIGNLHAMERMIVEKVHVAVLVEPELGVFAGQLSLTPGRVKPILAEAGIAAVELTAAEVADPAVFNYDKYKLLAVPYGNAFPVNVAENLRAFRERGGGLLMNGIPFCHPAEYVNGHWKDMGHVNYLHHDEKGFGSGDFGSSVSDDKAVELAADNPLGIHAGMLPARSRQLQWLNTRSFPKEDEIIPLIMTKTAQGEPKPAVALIRHKCEMFQGACDVWMGQYGYYLEERDDYYLRQLIGRGTAWALAQMGAIGDGQRGAVFARLDKKVIPDPLARGIEIVSGKRSWGDTFLPRTERIADEVLVVDVRRLGRSERIALSCLQGLTARDAGNIWLIFNPEDRFWLNWHVKKGYIKKTREVTDWKGLFGQFAGAYRGAVVWDEKLYRGDVLAVNVASCEDLILCDAKLARELGLRVKADLRGRFDTYHEGMRWVWEKYRGELNHHVCDMVHPGWMEMGAFSYDIQWKGIVFWIAGPRDGMLAGADPVKEMTVMSDIFSQMPANVGMLGFCSGGEGIGLGEVGGTSFCGSYGKILVCTDRLSNVPITSGVGLAKLDQPMAKQPPKLEKDKVYAALVYSDGDNQNTWRKFFLDYFQSDGLGEFPLSFGMGPPIVDLQPGIAQWYYEHAPEGTEFIADVSGIGYIRPEDFAIRFGDRQRVYREFLDWTGMYMKKMDMGTMRTVSGGDEFLSRYIERLGFMHSFFADMGSPGGISGYENKTYMLDGMPVFRSLIGWGGGRDGFVRDVVQNVGEQRPAFVNLMIHAWTFGSLEQLQKAVDDLPEDYVIVTPSQLAQLYQQAKRKGWARK